MKHGVPFSGLIAGSFELMKRKGAAVLIAVFSFAMLSAVTSAFVERRIDAIEETLSSHVGLSREVFEKKVQEQVNALSSLNMQEFVVAMETRFGDPSIGGQPALPEERLGITYIARVGPYILLVLLIDSVIAFVAYTFFLVLFSRGSLSAYEAAVLLPKYVATQSFLFLWAFFRSLVWIPLIGPLIGLYFLPRLSLAPIIHASGEAGARESIQMSMRRTSGQWSVVVLRTLGLCLVMILCLWPSMVLVAAVTLFSLKIGYVLWLSALIAAIAFFAAGQTMLTAMLA